MFFFRLIVIADKETVYESFPIPLINRLEKHYVVTSTCMTKDEEQVVAKLKKWAHDFSHVYSSRFVLMLNKFCVYYSAYKQIA